MNPQQPSRRAGTRGIRVVEAQRAWVGLSGTAGLGAKAFAQRTSGRLLRYASAIDVPDMALRPPVSIALRTSLQQFLRFDMHVEPRVAVTLQVAGAARALAQRVEPAAADTRTLTGGPPAALDRVVRRSTLLTDARRGVASPVGMAMRPATQPATYAEAAPVTTMHAARLTPLCAPPELVVLRAPAVPAFAAVATAAVPAVSQPLRAADLSQVRQQQRAAQALGAPDIRQLTDRVVEVLDRRLLAARERMGTR